MPSMPAARPLGGPMARRQLHFFYVLDRSGSMNANGKIQALNIAMAESLPLLRSAAADNAAAEVLVRALTFSDGARWESTEPIPVERFRWTPIAADGLTDLGAALRQLAQAMETPPMPDRMLPPVVVLVSDGQPTDDYRSALETLMRTSWGPRSVRLSVAIGSDADREVLQEFIGYGSPRKPLQADDPDAIIEAIQWATTAATRMAVGAMVDAEPADEDVFPFVDSDA